MLQTYNLLLLPHCLPVLMPPNLPAPVLVAAAGERAAYRFLEFFTAQTRNPNTRRAYVRAVGAFCAWLDTRGLPSIAAVSSIHVAAYVEDLGRRHTAPTVKQHLAAIRMLFDWLATGGVLPFNPATAVRGPKHVVKRGKTPVLAPGEARAILDAIDTTTPIGLRDQALIGLMVYTFARIGAATAMPVEDVYVQNRRLWVRLHEKGGKAVDLPCHHNLETYLHAYLDGTGIVGDGDGPTLPHAPAGGQRLRHGPATHGGRRDRHEDRQPHLPGHRHHRLPQERRHPGARRRHRQPRLDPHHPALRPPLRRREPRRDRAHPDLRCRQQAIPKASDKRKSIQQSYDIHPNAAICAAL